MNSMPSKKALSILILTVALVIAIILIFGGKTVNKTINATSGLIAGDKISLPKNSDWQDELDQLNIASTSTNKAIASSTETITDTVSKTLMANYLALKQSDNLNDTTTQELVDKTFNYIQQTTSSTTQITEKDLDVVADNGLISMKEYGENFGSILKNNAPTKVKNELEIMTEAMKSEDSKKMDELDSIISVYEKIAADLIQMPVSKTFIKAHLDLINSASGMALSLTKIKIVFSDPIDGLTTLQSYNKNATTFVQAKKAIATFLLKNNIVYEQGTGGYYLLYGI